MSWNQMKIQKLHADWAAKVLPADASQAQRAEMERAYYSGFFSALSAHLHHVALLPDAMATSQVQAWHEECEAYFKTLGQAGKEISGS